jgi:membrane dipeptidase
MISARWTFALVLVSTLCTAAGPDPRLLERARALLDQAPLIDTHNDLPTMLVETLHGDLSQTDFTKEQPTLCADLARLAQGHVGAQYWSIWVDSANAKTHTSLHEAVKEFDALLRLIDARPELELARSAADIERIHKAGKIASLIGVEGGHMLENSPEVLRVLARLGAKYLTLTHWDSIDWADAATDRNVNGGLTVEGQRFVHELNRLGLFVDLSHVSADTMRDVLRVTKAPVIFSHSNAQAIDGHPRNVPDDVLALVKANGGVVHVNFIREFIAPDELGFMARRAAQQRALRAKLPTDEAVGKALTEWEHANLPAASISQVADHIDHLRKVAGIDAIGIGADYAGVEPTMMVEGLPNVSGYPLLFAELLRRGYSDEDVLKIAGRNHLRAMRAMEKVAESMKQEAPMVVMPRVAK